MRTRVHSSVCVWIMRIRIARWIGALLQRWQSGTGVFFRYSLLPFKIILLFSFLYTKNYYATCIICLLSIMSSTSIACLFFLSYLISFLFITDRILYEIEQPLNNMLLSFSFPTQNKLWLENRKIKKIRQDQKMQKNWCTQPNYYIWASASFDLVDQRTCQMIEDEFSFDRMWGGKTSSMALDGKLKLSPIDF